MRFALAILAALANAAGPWLCCCLMAVMVSKPAKADAPKTTAKCSHCKDEPADTKAPAKPTPAKPCPCQEHLTFEPSAVQPATETVLTADTISHDSNLFVEVVAVLPTPSPAPSQLADGPFLTSDTRLHVHHVLRC